MTAGRPSKYEQKYCEMLIEHMSQGLSFEAFAGLIKTHKDTLYEWIKVHPEFSDAKKTGTEQSRMFWEKLGINHIINVSENFGQGAGSKSTSLNAAIWVFNMKNRFGWRDRQPDEVETVVNNNQNKYSPEELKELIKIARGK